MSWKQDAEKCVGKKFNMLTIQLLLPSKNGRIMCQCICDCGKQYIGLLTRVKNSRIKSCGCLKYSSSRSWEPIDIDNGSIGVPLTKGKVAIIDKDMLELVRHLTWSYSDTTGYAINNKRKQIPLHRIIMNGQKMVDHIDRDTLNNRRSNLRACTHSDNLCNRGAQTNNKSGYKGVSYNRWGNRWTAGIKKGPKRLVKHFHSKHNAAKQYNIWAKELHGEFAYQNILEVK